MQNDKIMEAENRLVGGRVRRNEAGMKRGPKRTTGGSLVVMEVFCVLTVSIPIFHM